MLCNNKIPLKFNKKFYKAVYRPYVVHGEVFANQGNSCPKDEALRDDDVKVDVYPINDNT